jgi:hypothetical protein
MKLQHTKEVRIVCDYWDLEQLIQEVYGKEYEIVPMEEWNNDEQHSYSLKKEKLQDWEKAKLDAFLKGDCRNGSLRGILRDLCNKGELEEGDYLINVSW